MADKKISALTAATTPLAGTEVLPVVQSGSTVKVAVSDLTAGRSVSASALGIGVTNSSNNIHVDIPLGGASNPVLLQNSAATVDGRGSDIIFRSSGTDYAKIEGMTQTDSTGGRVRIHTSSGGVSALRLEVDRFGDVNNYTGNFVLGTAGKGIDFSANGGDVLTQYDEGTWTPAIAFATNGNLAVTYSTQSGTYTRVGRQVTVSFVLVTSSFTHTTASGALRITGTPFNAGNTFQHTSVAGLVQGVTKANYTTFGFYANAGSTDLTSAASGSAQNFDNITAANMPTGGSVILACTLTYFV